MSCEAVGHFPLIDEYVKYFDEDAQRKFLREYRITV